MFGKNIRVIRKSLNLTQDEFAQPLEISGKYISDIERNKNKPSDRILGLIEIKYRINRNWLETSQGEKYVKQKAIVGEQGNKYTLHGDPPTISWEEFCGVPLGLGFDKAVDLLADVFRPGDKILIDEAVSVLNRLAQNIEMQNQFNALKTEMNQIKNIQPDRRHGKNRRQIVTPNFPVNKEQRSGIDRRNQ